MTSSVIAEGIVVVSIFQRSQIFFFFCNQFKWLMLVLGVGQFSSNYLQLFCHKLCYMVCYKLKLISISGGTIKISS